MTERLAPACEDLRPSLDLVPALSDTLWTNLVANVSADMPAGVPPASIEDLRAMLSRSAGAVDPPASWSAMWNNLAATAATA